MVVTLYSLADELEASAKRNYWSKAQARIDGERAKRLRWAGVALDSAAVAHFPSSLSKSHNSDNRESGRDSS